MGVAIGEQIGEALHGGLVRRAAIECRQVQITSGQARDFVAHGLELGQQLTNFELAQGVAAREGLQVQGHGVVAGWQGAGRTQIGRGASENENFA